MPLPYKLGSSDLNTDREITPWGQWFARKYKSYAAPVDGYFGYAEQDAVKELQRRLGIPVTGVFDAATAAKAGYTGAAQAHRPIWFYSAPGSGADWWVGPSFDVGQWVASTFGINHQPVGFPKGGYLGLMGGDPSFSYNDVIAAEGAELERLIDSCPDLNDPNLELWFSAYSQSADGMKVAVNRLFGDGGKYEHLRGRINGLILFGDPTRQQGPTKVGNNPAGWGISRKVFPKWVNDLTWSITNDGDFYACTDDEIRPPFYAIIVQAETELPFFVHVLKIALPVIANLPFIGAFLGPIMTLASPLMGMVNGPDEQVDKDLVALLSAQGILTHIPDLLKLVGSLPGIQVHGDYYSGRPEFGGRGGVQVACDIVKDFRR